MHDDLEPVDLVEELSLLMEGHHVPFHVEKEWVVPYGKLPAVRATWYPGQQAGRLDVHVLLNNEGEIIEECFAGLGEGDVGKSDALKNFLANSYHVLLAAFWKKNDPRLVTAERWRVGKKTYIAFVGNFGVRGAEGVVPEIPAGLFECIRRAAKSAPLTHDCCWIRSFAGGTDGDMTFESLLNNEVWEPGLKALRSVTWSKSQDYYSVRNFIVLLSEPTWQDKLSRVWRYWKDRPNRTHARKLVKSGIS